MINLHESMVLGRDRTRDPWICSQTHICSQTRYRLRYAARFEDSVDGYMFRVMKYIFGFHSVPARSVLGFQTVATCNLQFLIILMFFFFKKSKGSNVITSFCQSIRLSIRYRSGINTIKHHT